MMNQGKVHAIWGVIVIILVAAIAYLVFNKPNSQPIVSDEQNAVVNTETNTVTETTPPVVENNIENNLITYTNTRFGFTLNLPERWKGYKVTETKDTLGYHYAFKILHSDGTYRAPFTIGVFTTAQWKLLQKEYIIPTLISEKNGYVFTYSSAQDDEGYVGFPDVISNEPYQGPIYDVKTVIIPSFKFTSTGTEADLKTYTNSTYKYSFDYPSQYTLKNVSSGYQFIKDVVSILVHQPVEGEENIAFNDLMFQRVKGICEADGRSGGTTCSKYAKDPVAFKTTSGLTAYTLVFVEQSTKYDENNGKVISVTNRDRTVYVVSLGGSGKDRVLLSIDPFQDLEVAKNLTLSVKKIN